MKIKTRLIITAIITLGLAFFISYVLFSTTTELKKGIEESKISDEMLKGIFELNTINNKFLLYHEQRAEDEWKSKYNSIHEFIKPEYYNKTEEFKILNENYKKIEQIFDNLNSLYKNKGATPELEDKLTNQLLLLFQDLYKTAFSLNEKANSEVISQVERVKSIVTGTIIIFVLIILMGIWMIFQTVMKPIAKLQKGVKKIGQRDLKYKIDIKSKDEIGQLALAFNEMADEISASQSNLEDKVSIRTEELEEKKISLEKQQQAILNILEDIEEEKTNVSKEKDKIDAILQSIGDGVFVISKGRTIFMFNQAAAEISGFDSKKVIDKNYQKVMKFIDEKEGTYKGSFIEEAMEHGEVVELPMHSVLVKKDKKTLAVAAIASPLKDKSDKVIGCVIVFRNVEKEREIDKTKSEFVSLASHQLRTPLSAINWYVEMLMNGDAGELNDEQNEFLEQMYLSNQRMVELVNSLLNVSRLELGTFIVEPESLDIVQLAKEAVCELKALTEEKKIKILGKYDDIPHINLDKKLTYMIFQNLLSNAVKYSPEDTNINISVLKNENNVDIEISDKGVGIPKSQQNKMFTKLFRADNVKKLDTTGTGLGLYILKSILDNVGGKIDFESTENKGSTFYVSIPLKGMVKKKGVKKLS